MSSQTLQKYMVNGVQKGQSEKEEERLKAEALKKAEEEILRRKEEEKRRKAEEEADNRNVVYTIHWIRGVLIYESITILFRPCHHHL